jgi:hypothetical protein
MKPLLTILSKYLILFALAAVSVVFIFTNYIGYKEVKYLFGGLGIAYILACCLEAEVIASTVKGTQTFRYFTPAFITKRFIKVVFFICAGSVLLFPHSIINYLSFLCFLIAATEIVVTLWRYLRGLCFAAFEGDTFLLATNKITTVYAEGIEKIEKRHGITYLVYENKGAITLRTDFMKERPAFDAALSNWITKNHLEGKVVASS